MSERGGEAPARLHAVFAHSALQSLAENAGGLFVTAFLVSQGVSQPLALTAFAALVLTRFAMRPMVLPLALRIGLRGTAMTGIVIRALGYALLAQVQRADGWLVAYTLVMGLGSVLYWTSWHAFNAAIATSGARGRQVSGQQAATAAVAVVAPAAGGFALSLAGPEVGFGLIAAIQVLAALPLLAAPNPAVAPHLGRRAIGVGLARPLYFAEGIHSGCVNVVWSLALFVSLGAHFSRFGGAMALAGFAAAAASLIAGRHIDAGRGRQAMVLAYGLAALAATTKAFAFAAPATAVAATAFGALVTPLTQVALLPPLYAMARHSDCPLRFAMATEAGWDLGCATACLAAAASLTLGTGYRPPILIAVAAIALVVILLRQWYARAS